MRDLVAVFTMCVLGALPAFAFEPPQPSTKLVDGPMQKLAPILGTWEIDSEWLGGDPIKARNEYTVGLGGKFIYAKTFAESESGGIYQRYFTVFGFDDEKQQYVSWGFTYDGTSMTVPMELREENGKVVLTSQWNNERTGEIRQSVTLGDESAYGWQVWKKTPEGEWLEIINSEWEKVAGSNG